MHISTALQDEMLEEIINERVPVTIFLMNGFQLRGMVIDHDDAGIALETEGKQQFLYKHAISTIAPMRPIKSLKNK